MKKGKRKHSTSDSNSESQSIDEELSILGEDFKDLLTEDTYELLTYKTADIPEPQTYTADAIKSIRKKMHVSQPVFASIVGVKKGAISAWECGARSPDPTVCRFMRVLEREGMAALQ